MGSAPVTISRTSAEQVARLARHLLTTSGEIEWGETAVAELEAALTATAEGAAWEPFRTYVLAYIEDDHALDARDRAALDQLVAKMRETFAQAGMAIDDPVVVRTIFATVSVVVQYGHDYMCVGLEGTDLIGAVCRPIALAASRLVDPEALT